MTITLYQYQKRENSTARPSGGSSIQGTLRNNSSVVSPTIEFSAQNLSGYNYAYIPLFSRWYFIRNWSFIDGLWLADMECDTLATYRDQIGASEQFVVRSSAASNGDLIDSMYPAQNTAQTVKTETDSPWSESDKSYIVGIIADSSNGGAVTYYNMTPSQFEAFSDYMLSTTDYLGTDFGTMTIDQLKVEFNPLQYVASVTAIPFRPSGFSVDHIPFGWWSLETSAGIMGDSMSFTFYLSIPKHPQADRGTYLNGPPYSAYTACIPAFGTVPLDSNILAALSQVFCQVDFDTKTASAILYIRSEPGGTILYKAAAPFGAGVQVGQFAQNQGAEVVAGFDIIGGAIKAVTTGDFGGLITGANDAIGNMFPQMATKGSYGTLAEFSENPFMTAKFMLVSDDDNANIGRPLYAPRTISSVPGFIMVRDPDIAITGTAEEARTIKSYMEGGFFFE